MAIRHRGFRAKNNGVTPYMMWLLVGVAMGYRIEQDERQKRMYVLKTGTKDDIFVHATAVNALVGMEKLALTSDNKAFQLTSDGFSIAHDRLKQSGLNPRSIIKPKPTENADCAYSNDDLDPSTYVG